ncbi:related to member of RSC complex [Rhynchosporium graminicola]|uniref:Related to member of RSC complex n=1 Tax=Rhynchosporium graminicola TaxID=2792576 RepID=A0A1E1K3S2_9HELO|nr:related to member of RSC complex [Rhynchosporium commune]
MPSQPREENAPPVETKIETEGKAEEPTVPENNATPTEPLPTSEASAPPSAPASAPTPAPMKESAAAGLTKKDYEIMTGILHRITNHLDDEGREVAGSFQRVVSRRALPDYYEIIKEPIAFSTLRGKILKKQYSSYRDFIRGFALICHNAQVYNRPSALVYSDAITIRDLFKAELQKLVEDKTITAEDAELPDLGEIPDVEDSPPPDPDDEDQEQDVDEDEDEDEDEEVDEDDSDDDQTRRKGKKIRRSSTIKREGRGEDGSKEDPESQKKRGRPPKVHTPMEARINSVLKGLRKFRNTISGDLQILPFERLPDKSQMPEYYQEIKNPIAMDLIKKKAKRKKYHSVEQALKDLELMFENAKLYNLESSQVYKDAVNLQKEARILAEQEKKKPDSDFVDDDGRLPVPEILYNNEIWKVGDWVHLTNPNDVTKPIVAQIYRTWQDPKGEKWINACWYYRPEQTVHRYEKHFFENEVVKTGQYRDHKIEEVVDRCFVMFFTRFNKGRPRGFPEDKEVYVCEARYNEEKFKLNKIKTWASCVPDEVRDKDYEMNLFDVPRKMKKVPSPIKHLLREDAKEDDPLPKPTWGAPNAPPIVGAVHKRPRETNESPPPEPTPSPPPPSPEPVRRSITSDRQYERADSAISASASNVPVPSPRASQTLPQTPYGQQFAPPRPSASPAPLQHQNSYGSHGSTSQSNVSHTPQYTSQNSYQNNSASTPAAQQPNPLANYNHYQNSAAPAPRPVATVSNTHTSHTVYNPPRPIEVYTLPEMAHNAIPTDIRTQFHHDELGRVIFYTTPPLDINPIPQDKQTLGHSLRYLADKARAKQEDAKKRKDRAVELETAAGERLKRMKTSDEGTTNWIIAKKLEALSKWNQDMENGTDEMYRQLHGETWQEVRDAELAKLAVEQEEAFKRERELELFKKQREERKEVKIDGFRWV